MQLELPSPCENALEHSQKLQEVIIQACKKNGDKIPFKNFMQQALYHPGLGYYSAGNQKFGPNGDFITAPEISPLFGQCIAHSIQNIFTHLNANARCILELGAGTGKLAKDILETLNKLNALPEKYYILEVSADLIERQQKYLNHHLDNGIIERIEWLSTLPQTPINGVILANEVIDAMPVTAFNLTLNSLPQERYISYENNILSWKTDKPNSQDIEQALITLQQQLLEDGLLTNTLESEINLELLPWLSGLNGALNKGIMLFIDYGFPQHEYYHPDRTMGTIMCHYRHRSHTDVLAHIGLQDITAHVNFTHLAECALKNNLSILGFTTQQAFLLDNQLAKLAETAMETAKNPHAIAQQIQLLTSPNEMGELFKVMALGKNWPYSITGFTLSDHRHRL